LAALSTYWATGIREVVLTGVHLGRWGRDLAPETDLGRLLAEIELKLKPEAGFNRLRLSSLEPLETPLAAEAMKSRDWLAPHLHAPVQSGSDRILELMGRPYRRGRIFELLNWFKAQKPDLNLGTDLMCGFPGETSEDFEATVDLAEKLPFGYLHVFPFSARPGTRAAVMAGQVPESEKKKRAAKLKGVDRLKRVDFLRSQLGRRRSALVENSVHRPSGRLKVLTDNYLQALLPAGFQTELGEFLEVELAEPRNPWGLAEACP
jgi:threonylcarbamoyladenosine tRNA methylthiotransferase MtaB